MKVELPQVDIVIANPPWGVQKHGADRIFIEAALRCAPVLHILHSAKMQNTYPEGEVILEGGEFRMPAPHKTCSSRMQNFYQVLENNSMIGFKRKQPPHQPSLPSPIG